MSVADSLLLVMVLRLLGEVVYVDKQLRILITNALM